jgi:hypothetical protein
MANPLAGVRVLYGDSGTRDKKGGKCSRKRNIKTCSRNHYCRGKAVLHTTSVRPALSINHAKRMRQIILASVACLAVPYFSTLPQNDSIFVNNLLNIKCVLILSTTVVLNIPHSKSN